MTARSKPSQLPGEVTAQEGTILVAAATADELLAWANNTGASVEITEVGFIPETAVTGDDSNNFILQLKNKGTDGTGTTGVTDTKTYASGINMTAFNQDDLVLSSTAANLVIDDGEVVALNKTETGSGLELPAGIVVLKYKFV